MRLQTLFDSPTQNLLSVYFTAGYPNLNDTVSIAEWTQNAGADILEIGMPYSDPIADGPTIQASNDQALSNGMSIRILFDQLKNLRAKVQIPVLLMGYFNPVFQFGVENFCAQCQEVGIDGLIIPDMPLWEYETKWKEVLGRYGLFNIFLITPQTPESRIRQIDALSQSFIYMVSSASVTGAKTGISAEQQVYFERVKAMGLQHPTLIGFGISDPQSFEAACQSSRGAIVGSAFINLLKKSNDLEQDIRSFIHNLKGT